MSTLSMSCTYVHMALPPLLIVPPVTLFVILPACVQRVLPFSGLHFTPGTMEAGL